MINEYIAYLKNNPKGYWFKRKLYGWGWVPALWQGWAATLIYILSLVYLFMRIDENSHSISDTFIDMAVPFLVLTGLFILVCYLKGQKPRWQWGEEKE